MKNNSQRKKILLVDDDEIHLLTAELCLKDEYDVYKTKSGQEALNHLRKKDFIPDLIILDIIMPKMDGWEVYRQTRGISFLNNIPILFFTSVDGEEERALKSGACGYIKKPLEMISLKSAIAKLINNKNLEE